MNKFEINSAKFQVNIEGIDMKDCTSVSGLELSIEKLCNDNGAQPVKTYRKGQAYVEDIDFVRLFVDTKIYQWFKECQQGSISKRSASVIALNDKNEEMVRFNLEGCWPIIWRGPSFYAGTEGGLASEGFVLAVESIEIN